MRKILFFIFAFFAFLLITLKVNATAKISFPIVQLNNCASSKDCFSYCENPQNYPICWSYGKYILNKDVLGDATSSASSVSHITFPIASLGNCSSPQECKAYCDKAENRSSCIAFSQKMGLLRNSGQNSEKEKFLEDAKKILGCDDNNSCSVFCSKSENRQKCIDFAREEGIVKNPQIASGIIPTLFDITQTELGCDSATSCRAVCSQTQNLEKCREFAIRHNLYQQTNISTFPKPSGTTTNNQTTLNKPVNITCSTSAQCMEYCNEHPGVCPGFPGQIHPTVTGITGTQIITPITATTVPQH